MPVKKGKSARVARAIKAKEPELVEGPKRLLLVRGPSTSETAVSAAKDLMLLKKPDAKALTRKNDIRPFEDVSSLEFLCDKNECGAFLYVSHNKKRPHNLVLVSYLAQCRRR
jgi:ribosome production factor 2